MGIPLIQVLWDLPQMSELDAEPAFLQAPSDDPISTMLLAYRTSEHKFAVLAFDWEDSFLVQMQSPPQDVSEATKWGLKPRSFHRVDGQDARPCGIVITFPHYTFEIHANGPQVLGTSIEAKNSLDALLKVLSENRERWRLGGS